VDGIRYHRTKQDYDNMQRESDALCREYGLSVIEEPQRGKSKQYGEWQAEREGRQTWRSLVKSDVDTAIRQSMTERQFFGNLRQAGYEIKTGKDISVRPPGKERFVRLIRNFGEDYSIDGIRKRILSQMIPERPIVPQEPQRKQYRVIGTIHTVQKATGLRALYFYYLYKMGVLPKKRTPNPKQVYFLFREDIRHMRNIARETRLLVRNSIDTGTQLTAYREKASAQMETLSGERKQLRNKMKKASDPQRTTALKSEVAELTKQIGKLRKEVRLCDDIDKRSADMSKKLHTAKDDEKDKNIGKEKKAHEQFRGCR
jgi:hypothetical protein